MYWSAIEQVQGVALEAPPVPSHASAQSFVRGEPGSGAQIGLHYAERAALLAAALWIAGERKHLVRYALVGSAAIEAFVLWWAWRHRGD